MLDERCKNCPSYIPKPYKKRKLGLKTIEFNNKDLILRGATVTDGSLHEGLIKEIPKDYRFCKSFWMYVWKKDLPKRIHFSGNARLSFDGYLKDEDYKRAPEEGLYNFEYQGKIGIVCVQSETEKEWVVGIIGDFNYKDLPLLLATSVQVRISPLEDKIEEK